MNINININLARKQYLYSKVPWELTEPLISLFAPTLLLISYCCEKSASQARPGRDLLFFRARKKSLYCASTMSIVHSTSLHELAMPSRTTSSVLGCTLRLSALPSPSTAERRPCPNLQVAASALVRDRSKRQKTMNAADIAIIHGHAGKIRADLFVDGVKAPFLVQCLAIIHIVTQFHRMCGRVSFFWKRARFFIDRINKYE